MKKKIRAIIDCDEVLSDFVGGAVQVYNIITERCLDPASLTEWKFTEHLEFENRHQKDLFDKTIRAPGFALSLKVLPGAKEGMKKLQEKVDVHIVTSPLSGAVTWAHERELWLDTHFGIPHHRVHHSQSKFVFSADLFVDDKPENVTEWQEHHPHGAAFLWDTLRNRQDKELERIHSWDDLLERISGRRTK